MDVRLKTFELTNKPKENVMKTNSLTRRSIGSILIVALTLMGVQAPAMADIVSTDQLVAEQRADAQRATVAGFLAREDVRERPGPVPA